MKREDGFSLIEVMIATGILATGLLALVGLMTFGLSQITGSSATLIAREKAREAVESVHTARDMGELSWSTIQNDDKEDGVFLVGEQPLTTPGEDGLVNTADDGPVEKIQMPGKDKLLGTADDDFLPLDNFTREIRITDLTKNGSAAINENLREITVIIRYKVQNQQRSYTLRTYVSKFA